MRKDFSTQYQIEWSDDKQLVKKIENYLQVQNIDAQKQMFFGRTILDSISISDGQWFKKNISVIARIIKRWKNIEKIDLSSNFEEGILYQISHIKFPDLVKISLKRNSIKSIEPICRINCPNLKSLDLSLNNITEVKSLRKFNVINKLVQINLYGNFIKEFDSISELSSSIKGINLQYHFNQLIHDEMNWIAKISSKSLQVISNFSHYKELKHKQRIINKKKLQVLKQSRVSSEFFIHTSN